MSRVRDKAIAEDLLDSDFTSIQQRIFDYAESKVSKCIAAQSDNTIREKVKVQKNLKQELQFDSLPEAPLMPFSGSLHTSIHQALPFTLEDYFELVDGTGRVIRDDKRGAISEKSMGLVQRLGIEANQWLEHITHFGKYYSKCVGSVESIEEYAERFNYGWGKDVGWSRQVYSRCAESGAWQIT